MKRFSVKLIRFYQLAVSPYLMGRCRYVPSCSQYMREAIETHGVSTGFYQGLKRVLRCHPLGGSGYDPVHPIH